MVYFAAALPPWKRTYSATFFFWAAEYLALIQLLVTTSVEVEGAEVDTTAAEGDTTGVGVTSTVGNLPPVRF